MMDGYKRDRAKTTIDTTHNLMHLACKSLIWKPPKKHVLLMRPTTTYITDLCPNLCTKQVEDFSQENNSIQQHTRPGKGVPLPAELD